MRPKELLEANLGIVERAIAAVCAQAGLRGADADDFGASVKLALVDDDYAIVRKWEGRSSFATYVTVVIRRLLVDQRRAAGRFFTSAAAKREGAAAVLLERLLARDRRSPAEAFTIVREAHPEVSSERLAAMTASLPARAPAAQLVPLEALDEERLPGPQRAEPLAATVAKAAELFADVQSLHDLVFPDFETILYSPTLSCSNTQYP